LVFPPLQLDRTVPYSFGHIASNPLLSRPCPRHFCDAADVGPYPPFTDYSSLATANPNSSLHHTFNFNDAFSHFCTLSSTSASRRAELDGLRDREYNCDSVECTLGTNAETQGGWP